LKQQAIKVPEPKEDNRSLHEILLGIVAEFGPRKHEALMSAIENATGRQISKGHFSEVLDGKKHWPQDWIDYIVDHLDHRSEVASYYARRRGLRVTGPRLMSKAEELRRLKYALAQHNAIGTAIQQEAAALPDDVFADGDEP